MWSLYRLFYNNTNIIFPILTPSRHGYFLTEHNITGRNIEKSEDHSKRWTNTFPKFYLEVENSAGKRNTKAQ